MLLPGPFPTPASTPRAPIDNAVIRVACHRCITNQTGQRPRQKGPLSEHPVIWAPCFRSRSLLLEPIEGKRNFGNGELETEVNKDCLMEPLEPADRELACSNPQKKKEYGTFQISFCFKLAFPNTCDLLTLAQSRNAVISVNLSEHGEMATRGLPIRPPRPRLRMVTLPAPWRRPVAFHRPK